ncbi:uncharacterized protein GLRG_11394 [Colletotrichum graminicola M1.001]|uniref:Uncharacterized protein n=1 Tax=Colletotrichum graminicola (strain M1.001 / M2 / FGSC 10212) TaxID=645133 RepID=E3QZG1_COLGM|nr:uncharacterized protein GLRG_11394 [Colletotrichum graminicola M1.001]EFQ36249.1 hypothetical protein GLRG_11394 [Colletotrichum graminicola M1.001]
MERQADLTIYVIVLYIIFLSFRVVVFLLLPKIGPRRLLAFFRAPGAQPASWSPSWAKKAKMVLMLNRWIHHNRLHQ